MNKHSNVMGRATRPDPRTGGHGAKSASTRRRAGSMMAASEVSGRPDLMASTRQSMIAARRMLWAWKKSTDEP